MLCGTFLVCLCIGSAIDWLYHKIKKKRAV